MNKGYDPKYRAIIIVIGFAIYLTLLLSLYFAGKGTAEAHRLTHTGSLIAHLFMLIYLAVSALLIRRHEKKRTESDADDTDN